MKLINGVYHPEPGFMLMIRTDGKLAELPPYMELDKRAEGWQGVTNAKRNYYPEYDRKAGGSKAPKNIVENLEEEDILPGEWI